MCCVARIALHLKLLPVSNTKPVYIMKKELKKIGLQKKVVMLLDDMEQQKMRAGNKEGQWPTLCGSCPTIDSSANKTTSK
jgi:hypothetical protein